MATCMPIFGKLKQRLTPGAGKKAAAAVQRKSEDASGSETTAEKSRQAEEEQRQEKQEAQPAQQEEEKQEAADEEAKREGTEEEKTGEQQQQQGKEVHEAASGVANEQTEPAAVAATTPKAEEEQAEIVEAAKSSNFPNAAQGSAAEGAEDSAAAAGDEHGELKTAAAAGEKLPTDGSGFMDANASHRSRLGSADTKAESPLACTAGQSSADRSSSAVSTLARGCSRTSSLGLRGEEEKEEAALGAVPAADNGSAATASVPAAAPAAAKTDNPAGNLDAAAFAPAATPASGGGPFSRASSASRNAEAAGTEDETAAEAAAEAAEVAEAAALEAAAASMRRKGSLAAVVEEKKEAEKRLEDVTRERDALSKQLEQTAAFYTQHIQRITEIYNSVVEKAQATEQKKNRYAEKLAELVVAGKVGEPVSAFSSAATKTAGDAVEEPQSVQRLQEELQAVRIEKQELEERVAELVDRCAALQQALLEAGEPSRSSSSPLPPLPQFSSARSRLLSQKGRSGSSTRLWNDSAAGGGESGESVLKKKLQQERRGSRVNLARPTRSGSALAMTPAARKSSTLLGGGAAAAAGISAEDVAGGGEEGGEQEEEELLLQRPEDRLFKGEEAVFQELESSSLQHQPQQLEQQKKYQVVFPEARKEEANAATRGKEEEQDAAEREDEKKEDDDEEAVEEAEGEMEQVPVALLSKRLSRKGVEAFLTEEKQDGDNSVLNSIRSRRNMSLLLQDQQQGSDQDRLVTPLCCGRRTAKGDLREMKSCSCTVCRLCLKEALLASKAEIRNFIGMDTATNGGATWKVACPRCGCKQGVSATLARAFTSGNVPQK